jgi:hypothetical protein
MICGTIPAQSRQSSSLSRVEECNLWPGAAWERVVGDAQQTSLGNGGAPVACLTLIAVR